MGQVIVGLARAWDTFSILAYTATPPDGVTAIGGVRAACGFCIGDTGTVGKVVVFFTSSDLARTGTACHGLGIFRHLVIAVMTACTTVRRACAEVGTRAIAIAFFCQALGAAFTACTDKIAIASGTCGTAACIGIFDAFARLGFDMKAVDALQELARSLCTRAAFPASDRIGTRSAMHATIFDRIALTRIGIDVHALGAFADCACRL